jgi:hypothetical protein
MPGLPSTSFGAAIQAWALHIWGTALQTPASGCSLDDDFDAFDDDDAGIGLMGFGRGGGQAAGCTVVH